jgi:DNA-binding NarL/FixJ family response regulator
MLPTAEKLATIVICEDDALTREALCENFEADRFEPLAAATAEEALRFCRYATPDVLLIDIGLPDASGLDVIREIRAATGPRTNHGASPQNTSAQAAISVAQTQTRARTSS